VLTGALCNNGFGDDADDYESPILIDLDRGEFRLTGLSKGVLFDIDCDGQREKVAWTESASADAWLTLDRNANGVVDDCQELFGTRTAQPASREPNGYLALAVFDLPENGGNGDGWISAADAAYDDLRLWTDVDQDGISSIDELWRPSQVGVVAIGLRAIESRRRDRHGNEFRYSGLVRLVRGISHSADVFLLTASDD
jgi:hypothetical protein